MAFPIIPHRVLKETMELAKSSLNTLKNLQMAKDRSGLPRFLFCSNPLVNDQEFILHTTKPNCLLKVKQAGKITCEVVRLWDDATPEEIREIEKEAATKYYYFDKERGGTNAESS